MALPKDYDPDQALLDCVAQQNMGLASYEDQTRSTLEEGAPYAAQAIIHLAMYSTNERIKLDAARYVVDRMLGKIGEEKQKTGALSPLEGMLAEVVVTAEALANGKALS